MVTVPWIEHIAQMTRAFIAKREKNSAFAGKGVRVLVFLLPDNLTAGFGILSRRDGVNVAQDASP